MAVGIEPEGERKLPTGFKLDGDVSQLQQPPSSQGTGGSAPKKQQSDIEIAPSNSSSSQISVNWDQEWEWTPPKSPEEWQVTRTLLSSRAIAEYVRNPPCAKPDAYFWRVIPRKRRTELRCADKPFATGWGLVATMQYSLGTFIIIWFIPLLVLTLGISVGLTVHFHLPADSATGIIFGVVGLESLVFAIVVQMCKSRGLTE
jgi:hypothetical protein